MSTITKLYTFSSGATILAEEHNSNFDTIYNWANGNITNANIKSGAAIALSKLDLTNDATLSGDITFSGEVILGTPNQGDVLYDDGTKVTRLTPGTDGQYLKTQGAAANPVWATVTIPDAIPTGTVIAFAGSSAPAGYLICDGATVSQTTYANLYAVVGHTYGADPGGGDFILPDARQRVSVGKHASGTFDTLGKTGGAETHTLTTAEMPAHTHTVDYNNAASDIQTGFIASSNNSADQTATTSSAGSGSAHNNLQPYIVFNMIIKT